jgi:hypothetical protein
MVVVGVLALAGCSIDNNGAAQQGQQNGQQNGGAAVAQQAGGAPAGQQGTPGPGGARPTLDPTAAAVFQALNRLEAGTLYLADSGATITKDQAVKLLPYWQDIQSAMQPPAQTSTPDPNRTPGAGQGGRGGRFFGADAAKFATDVAGIQAALTPDQLATINALTQDQMTATLQKHGINRGFGFGGPAGGQGGFGNGGTPGTQSALATSRAEGTPRPTPDANQLATFQAQRNSGQGRQGDPLVAEVVKVLQALAAG